MATSTVSGTLTADQPTSTAVAGGSLTLPIDNMTAWSVLLGGTFSSGSTVLFEFTVDGTTYTACSMVQDGTSNPSQTSVAGPQASPIQFTDATGDTAAKIAVRARCHPYHAGDAITASLSASGPSVVTTNAGTGTSTALLAQESGGNLAAVATNTATTATNTGNVATTTGATADAAVQGDNAGTISAKLRGIAKSIAAGLGVTLTDGADSTQGAKADAAWTSGSGSLVAILKAIAGKIPALGSATSANSLPMVVASDQAAIPTIPQAGASGGASYFFLLSASNVNNTLVKSSPGHLYGYTITNTTAATMEYVKFVNKATTPSAGSESANLAHIAGIPGNTTVTRSFPVGLYFPAGIAFYCVTGKSNGDGTAITGQDLMISLDYK